MYETEADEICRVRTLTGKEIELDIEADYKVRDHLQRQTDVHAAGIRAQEHKTQG
jgi:hypothetical protein